MAFSAIRRGSDAASGARRGKVASTIPPTLQQSLTARLDWLGSAREVAQVGAIIGFSYCLLRAVAEMDDAPLHAALEKLAVNYEHLLRRFTV
jgi:hypothetical protein